ncbi:MAG: HicB family protein [Candidatus Vogelbacteria bacterium CG10_big_fil_rev_8_21_14_0_10_45_14]|uniref:HicB family protein n=1 Tax=Candidatus Vogelbacteria bacterium CG10_big_fil_rev_8_21_14_0_10_45_14 TaxID=1975042 RepID=A0A2H0RKX3_9BACT|nr:MAG: HicB family protein [Candidatus Vogelbacteria bacterium CG10_big_fil_rev_8_21_14_0_10_45_14]
MTEYNLPVVIEKDKHGYYAYCPELQGCYTYGSTYEASLKNIRDAVKLHIEDRKAEKDTLPDLESLSLSTVKVFA